MNSPAWRGAISSLVSILVILTFLPAKYEVNDDIGMIISLAGQDGFAAAPDAPFVSRTLRFTLFQLYHLVPAVPWYGLALYLSLAIGLAGFATAYWRCRSGWIVRMTVIVAWAALLGHSVYSITFTSVTLILLLGGLLLLASEALTKPRGIDSLLVCLCFGFALLWRWPLVWYFLVFALPLLWLVRWQQVRRLLPAAAALVLLWGGDRLWEFQATTDQDQAYRQYTRLRSQMHDSPRGRTGENTDAALAAAGWHEDDYLIFRQLWMLYDEQQFNATKLHRFLAANQSDQSPVTVARVRQSLSAAWGANKLYLPIFLSALAAFALKLAAILGRDDRRRLWALVLSIFVPLSLLAYYRFVARVSMPLFAYIIGILLVASASMGRRETDQDTQEPPSLVAHPVWRLFFRVAILVVVSATLLACARMARVDLSSLRTDRQHHRFIRDSLGTHLQDSADPLLVRLDPRTDLGFTTIHPLRELASWPRVRLLPAGWKIHSPRYLSILEQLGYRTGRDLLRGAIDNPQVQFVLYIRRDQDDSIEVLRLWRSYIERNLLTQPDTSVAFLSVNEFTEENGNRLVFYRLTLTAVAQHR